MKFKNSVIVLLITAAITLAGNYVGTKVSPIEALPGVLILSAMAAVGILIAKLLPGKTPAVLWVVTLSTIMTIPGVPFADKVAMYTSKVNFLALCTPILAYAGIYTGKNIDGLKKTGWRIVVLALVVITGTYIGSALIAQLILKLMGQI